MTPKVFDTLLYLVENSGRVLTKDELLQRIWPETFVEEVNLAVNISTLRKLLGESPQDRRYVVTVSGRGYRFVAQVRKTRGANEERGKGQFATETSASLDGSEGNAIGSLSLMTPPGSLGQSDGMNLGAEESVAAQDIAAGVPPSALVRRAINRTTVIALGVIFLISAVAGIDLWRGQRLRKPIPVVGASIAVLPFADLSPNKDQEYFSDGLADELTNDLAQVRGLKVIARSSAFQFKGKNEDLRTVGRKLGVATILEGSVRRQGDRVKITTELTKVDDGFQLWSETYERDMNNVFAVQEEIARAVTAALQVRILDANGDRKRDADLAHFRRNPAAYEPYLQAQYFIARGEDKEDLAKALSYIDETIKDDPTFASAWALRSSILNTTATVGLSDHEHSYREAREDADKAIALDAGSPAGYVALAWVKINHDWDWEGADAALKKAAELQPGSGEVLSFRAYLDECLGRLDEAIALTEATSTVDPLRSNAYLGELLCTAGRYDEAQSAVRKAMSINPKLEGGHARLGTILLAEGQAADALAEMKMEPGEWQRLTGEALAYQALNRHADSDAALSRLIATHAADAPYQVAEIYAYRGESDRAFEWLNRSYQERDPGLNQMKLDPLLANLRSDQRFVELLRRMKL